MNNSVFESKQYKKNRAYCNAEALLEYFISILVSGAYLAVLMGEIGVSDAVTGVTTSLSHFAFMAQLFSVLFLRPKGVKRFICYAHLVNQLLFTVLYVIPFISVPHTVKVAVFVVMFLAGHLISNTVMPFKLSYMMSFVSDGKRGDFTAVKEMISLFGGMVFSFGAGEVIDVFKAKGETKTACVICCISIFVLTVLHFLSVILIKDDPDNIYSKETERKNLGDVIGIVSSNRNLKKCILVDMIWSMGSGVAFSFFGTYQIKELGFTMLFVSILSAAYSVARMLFSRFFGKFADRYSWAKMLSLSFLIGASAYGINIFCAPKTKYLYVAFYLVYAVYCAGSNSGIMNITFDYVSKEDRVYALGIKSAIGGIFGFLASLAGGKIVSAVQANNNIVLGHTIYAQQILSAIAFVLYLGLSAFIYFSLVKKKQ